MKLRKFGIYIALTFAISALAIRFYPPILLWPHTKKIGPFQVYSDLPVDRRVELILVSSLQYRARSSIASPLHSQAVFLTDGGWRWKILSLQHSGAFAISTPFSENIITNKTDIGTNSVSTGRNVGGFRPLDRVLAHEMTHGTLRSHFGFFNILRKPDWLVEGYCDYIADNSSLTEQDVRKLKAQGVFHPAIPYLEGRVKIEKLISDEKMTVDQLFSKY